MSEELSFYTTDELIVEILKRATFQGIIVRAEDFRGHEWQGKKKFNVLWNGNLSNEEVTRVIEVISEALTNTPEQEGEE